MAWLLSLALVGGAACADAMVGNKAPNFQANDIEGKPQRLSDYAGRIVVLEWSSPECLYSRRYYDNGTLDALYDFATQSGMVWMNIVPTPSMSTRQNARSHLGSARKIVVLDDDFAVSAAYGAATTPQIFIVDTHGVLAYSGAIDSSATLKKTAGPVVPYVRNALNDLLAGRDVAKKITQPFGCYIQRNH